MHILSDWLMFSSAYWSWFASSRDLCKNPERSNHSFEELCRLVFGSIFVFDDFWWNHLHPCISWLHWISQRESYYAENCKRSFMACTILR